MYHILAPLARKYIWWKTPEEAAATPLRTIAQVMDIGTYDDVQALLAAIGEEPLREALQSAQAGWFSSRSWHYWHYRLLGCKLDDIPPLPVRKFH